MSIVLFAIIGATIHAKTAYWICFSIYCCIRVAAAVYDALKD